VTTVMSQSRAELVSAALTRTGAQVSSHRPTAWEAVWPVAAAHVLARTSDDWLLLEAVLELNDNASSVRAPDLLHLNATLGGGAKFVRDPHGHLALRAEVPFVEDGCFDQLVCGACAGLVDGVAFSAGKEPVPRASAADESAAPGLRALCVETGWPIKERSAGMLAVELEVSRGFHQATLSTEPGRGIRAVLELVDLDDVGDAPRAVISQWLLQLGGFVRFARPILTGLERNTRGCMEVILPFSANSGELSTALASLSVAAGLGGEEAGALCDSAVAGEALAIWGMQSTNNQNQTTGKESP